MTNRKNDPPRGVLNQRKGEIFFHNRYHPSTELASVVEHYWIIRWDLKKRDSFSQDVLSHPSVHLVFEKNNTRITGVVTGKFTARLQGSGKVFGIINP